MYITEYILQKITVQDAYKVLYCIMNGDITDNNNQSVYQIINYYDLYINKSLHNIDTNRAINTLISLEYDDSSILDLILRFINNEEALRWYAKKQVIKDLLINHLNTICEIKSTYH